MKMKELLSPSARLSSNREDRHQRMTTRSSPKTPSHPSNGYEILERRKSLSSVVRSSARNSAPSMHQHLVGVNDNTTTNNNINNSPDSIDTSEIKYNLESCVQYASTRSNSSDTDTPAIAISQEDEYHHPCNVGIAKDDEPVSSNHSSSNHSSDIDYTTVNKEPVSPNHSFEIESSKNTSELKNIATITKRSRRQSSSTFESAKNKMTRRTSLRLHNIGMTRMVVPTQHSVEDRDDDAILSSSNRQTVKMSSQDPSPFKEDVVVPSQKIYQVMPTKSSFSSASSEITVGEDQEKHSWAPETIASTAIRPSPSDTYHVSLRKRKIGTHASELESYDAENSFDVNGSVLMMKKTRHINRRDTFDLSKKRGLLSSAKRMELDVCVSDQVSETKSHDHQDFITPRSGPSEIPWKHEETDDLVDNKIMVEENSVVVRNLEHLTHSAIDAKIAQLFPDNTSQIHKLPCVSARIFAAMNIVYEETDNFTDLLPLIHSLIEAEIISLQNKEKHETVCFISKKVCFSGFDYSSTISAVGAVVGQGSGDLQPSIDALRAVLQNALRLPRPIYCLDVAIQCLHCMTLVDGVSDCLSKTMVGYFPPARFQKAISYYLNELRDLKLFILSKTNLKAINEHTGVRNRLNDFIGRSIRYHLRELLNSIPDSIMKFNVGECEERWGRAVDDGSISSILNFSLEKIHEFTTVYPNLTQNGVHNTPGMFARDSSKRVFSMSNDELKQMDLSTYESLVMDITEARSFLFGARACSFVVALLNCPGVKEHVDAAGGWAPVEAMASTLRELHLHEGSENEHFVQLREVQGLLSMLEDVDTKLKVIVEQCEYCIRRLRRKLNFTTKSTFVMGLKALLAGELGENFPLIMIQ